jgi:thioredoxin 1
MPSPLPIYEATTDTFDALVFEPRGELVVVDFWGEGCPNCEVFAKDAPALLEALGDVPVRVVKVDAYTHDAVARRFAIFGIPTFLLVGMKGQKMQVLGKMSQYYGRDYWLAVVREHLPKSGDAAAQPEGTGE